MFPTPRASDAEHGGPNQRDSKGNYALPGAVAHWPTPKGNSGNGAGKHGQGGIDLQTAVKLWPTPKASDSMMGMTARTGGRPIEKSTHLQTQVYLSEKKMF